MRYILIWLLVDLIIVLLLYRAGVKREGSVQKVSSDVIEFLLGGNNEKAKSEKDE
jgi:hypothetical protein